MSRTPPQRRVREAPPQTESAPRHSTERLGELCQIPLDLIDVPPNPSRRYLGDIAALAESMYEYGLQQPISVRADGDRFKVTSGMRRLAAARSMSWPSIPAFVRTLSADDAYLVDLVENLQRQDLSAEEEADALGELIRSRGWTMQQVADGLKRSVAYVSKRVRVFEDLALREAVTRQGLPISTAEELLAAAPEQRPRLIARALAEHWDQSQAREAVRPMDLQLRARATQSIPSGHRTVARPRGFTRAVREFHTLIMTISMEDLTGADRSALRSLFRDLVLLGRSSSVSKPPVFPELPETTPPKRLSAARSRTTVNQKAGLRKPSGSNAVRRAGSG